MTVLVSAWALTSHSARALEVSLEENKAQRGNIGYVDMQRLFRLYPETQKAKQNFEEVLRQAEEQVNLRKAELIGLRAEVIKLRMEREAAARLAGGVTPTGTPPAPAPTQAAAPPAPPAPAPAPAVSTATAPAAAPAVTPTVSTEPAQGSLAVDRSTVAAAPPPAEGAAASSGTATTASPAASTATAAAPAPVPDLAAEAPKEPLVINLPGLSQEPIVVQPPAGTQAAASLNELDARLAEKGRVLQDKEAEFKTYQAQVEKNLLELEGKKTEILLGKIYHAVQDIAREEGVSVVVDKSQILFGHNAMDLTEKVLKRLRS